MGKTKILKRKELIYCEAILRGVGKCEAARQAGYSEKGLQVAVYRLEQQEHVRKYIEKEQLKVEQARRKEIEVDELWVTKQFREIYDRCMQAQPVMQFNRNTGELEQARDGETGQGLWTFDSTGAVRAMENIAKNIGYFEKDNKQRSAVIRVGIVVQNNIQINQAGDHADEFIDSADDRSRDTD